MTHDQDVLIITKEEAQSQHVDDLLNRQRNLRGERGHSEDAKPRWYMRTWFVLGAVGLLAGLCAAGVLEYWIDDNLYIQGEIEAADLDEEMSSSLQFGMMDVENPYSGHGWIQIRGQKLWLDRSVVAWSGDRTDMLFEDDLQPGANVGVYLEHLPTTRSTGVSIVSYVVTDPLAPTKKSLIPISDLFKRTEVAGLLLFAIVSGFIGLAIGAIDGVICRAYRRAFLAGLAGAVIGLVGGLLATIPAELVFQATTKMALQNSEGGFGGFAILMLGRGLAWSLAGSAMGLGQGIALRSGRLVSFGVIGGLTGGLLGGLLFDPIDLIIGMENPSAHWSRLVGFSVIGLFVGSLIGMVELFARDAWLRMTRGPLAGKEFLFFKDLMRIGASPSCELYLFNDPQVLDHHANLLAKADQCEIESLDQSRQVLVNDRPVRRARLRHGDRITVGQTMFVFQSRRAS